jgi:hypothetical protein
MQRWKVSGTMRVFFTVVATVLWLGIWLTGFREVHWLLYIPAAGLSLAAVTGICPGMFFSRLIAGNR